MKRAVIEMFNSRLSSMEGQLSGIIGVQNATLELVRDLKSNPATLGISPAEKERIRQAFAKSME